MELKDTVDLMNSTDPVERLKAEYLQVKIRVKSLEDFLEKHKNGAIPLPPYTNYNTLHRQFQTMLVYEMILEERVNAISDQEVYIQ